MYSTVCICFTKAVPVRVAAFSGFTMSQLTCASLISHPLIMVCSRHVMCDNAEMVLGKRKHGRKADLIQAISSVFGNTDGYYDQY